MEKKGNRKVQIFVAYAVSVGMVTTGALSSWTAPVMPKFRNNETDINITDEQIAWMVSITSPGFVAGSFLNTFIADRCGRKATILAAILPCAGGVGLIAFTVNAWCLYIARFLCGVGTGMLSTVVTIYMAEIADKEIRGKLALVTRFMFNFGNFLMMCIGPFVSYITLNYMMLALPVIYFAACSWIPESPYYCLKEGKVDAARKVLSKIRKYKDEKALEDDLLRLQNDVRNEMRSSSTVKELATGKKYRKAITIAAGLKTTQILTGQIVLAQYLGLIMMESGTVIKLSLIFIIFGAVRFLTGVMSSVLADKIGRRPLLIYSYLGTAVSLASVGLYFFLLEVLEIPREDMKPYSVIPFVGIIASNIISTLGYYSVIVVVPAEIFPLNIKAIALTALSIYGGTLNFFVGRGYQILKDISGLCGVFWFLALAAASGCVFSSLYVPETKGKSLREIQEQLQGDWYENYETITLQTKIGDVKNGESKQLLDMNKKVNQSVA